MRVLRPDGSAASAAKVAVFAAPVNGHAGRTVLHRVARVPIAPNGELTFPSVPVRKLRRYATPTGLVNLEVSAGQGAAFASFFYSVSLPGKGSVSTAPPQHDSHYATLGAPDAATFSTAAAATSSSLVLKPWRRPSPSDGSGRVGAAKMAASNNGKQWSAWTVVGLARSDTPGATVDFSYGRNQDSTLGVGVSTTGKWGTWSASGTQTDSSSGTVNFAPVTDANRLMKTRFVYRDRLETICFPRGGCYARHTARPVYWEGGAITAKAGPFSTPYCVPYQAGAGQVLSRQRAITWSNGVSLGDSIGLNLSAQTGYANNASLHIKFRKRGRLCGQLATPARNTVTVGSIAAKAR